MAVADVRDVVVGVEILPAGLVVEVLHPAADDLDGLAVGDREVRADDPLAAPPAFPRRACRAARGTPPRPPPDRARRAPGSVGAIGPWLIPRYSSPGRCRCWRSATQTLVHSRRSTSPNSDVDLVVVERAMALVAAHDGDRRRQRIRLAEDGVCDGDREIGDRVGVDDVAEVENPGDRLRVHQHVVVVRIVVHRGAPEPRESRRVRASMRSDHATARVRASPGSGDGRRDLAARARGRARGPSRSRDEWRDGRTRRARDRAPPPRRRGPPATRRVFVERTERNAWQPREQAHEMTRRVTARSPRDREPSSAGTTRGTERRPARDMRERRVLRLEQRAIVGAVGDLEDEAIAGRRLETHVLIALAGKRATRSSSAEAAARCRLAGRQRRCVLENVHSDYHERSLVASTDESGRDATRRGPQSLSTRPDLVPDQCSLTQARDRAAGTASRRRRSSRPRRRTGSTRLRAVAASPARIDSAG